MSTYDEALQTLAQRFGQDTFLSLATTDGDRICIRVVNSYYEDGAFYVVTNALSNKMKQIGTNSRVAITCGQLWGNYLNAHGVGENMGHVLAAENGAMMEKLRKVFASWYTNGDVNENDPNTCLLRIRLADAFYMGEGTGVTYRINFTERTA